MIATLLAAFALLGSPSGAAPRQQPITATEAPGAEICFPARLWSAWPEDQPCDLLERPTEDGSSTLYLGTRGADAATCVIPNPYEQRGRFSVSCHRVPNR
jgi:hypothetical protein